MQSRAVVAGLVAVTATVLAAGAGAKAPPSGIQLCGTTGCAAIGQQEAEQLFTLGRTPHSPVGPAPFYVLRWRWEEGQAPTTGGYWLPEPGALRLGASWAVPDGAVSAALQAAAGGLAPFSPAPPTRVTVGRRAAADPASYVQLLTAGSRVTRWNGALD
jgi:hypothetical protein